MVCWMLAVNKLAAFRDSMRVRSANWAAALQTWTCPTPPANTRPAGTCDPCGESYDGNWYHMHCRGNTRGERVACTTMGARAFEGLPGGVPAGVPLPEPGSASYGIATVQHQQPWPRVTQRNRNAASVCITLALQQCCTLAISP